MKEYAVIYERGTEGEENWGAYVPDLPGCVTTGQTFEEVQARIQELIPDFIDVLRRHGQPVPEPSHLVGMVTVAA
jgi:predicted RNase H-like HicB family nuclease